MAKYVPGINVNVAPEDLTDDDGFRDVGMIVKVISDEDLGDSDTYYAVWSEEDGELHAVHEDQVDADRPQDPTPDAVRFVGVVNDAACAGWLIVPDEGFLFEIVQVREVGPIINKTIGRVNGIDELEEFMSAK